jgi:3-methyladenine DNA glycosylase AlkD
MRKMKKNLYFEIFPRGAKNVPELRIEAKKWTAQNKDISAKDFERLVTAFIQDPSAMKKCMGGILLCYMPKQRSMLDPFLYEKWLEYAVGWGEIDAICYGQFTAEEVLKDYKNWKRLIKKLSQSDNINKRRASVVLLTKPVKQTRDKRLSELAFSIIDTLKDERSILITKALSWLLRNLIQLYREEVEEYLNSNKDVLPKIALRETFNKLRSGRKTGV